MAPLLAAALFATNAAAQSSWTIGRNYILGSYMDDADEMHVAAYRLKRQ
jgi:hypothetical protein